MRHLSPWFTLTAHDDPPPPAPDPAGGTPPPAPDPAGGTPPQTFSQEEVNAIVKNRAERMLRTQLGVDDDFDLTKLPDLKAAADKYAQLEAEQLTELEKEKARTAQLQAELDQSRAAQRERALADQLVAAARQAGFVDPTDAAALVDRSALDVADDGTATNAADLVAGLAKAKPHLLAPAAGGGGDGGAKPVGGGAKDFTTAPRGEFAAELAKHGLRPRT